MRSPNKKRGFITFGIVCCATVVLLVSGSQLATARTWSQITPSGTPPAGRFGHTAVYNNSANTMIVFGGHSPTRNDTWILANADGTTGTPAWTPLFPTGSPPRTRAFHTAVYAHSSNSMILFGGWPFPLLNDVWVLTGADGTNGAPRWVQLTPAGPLPPARYNHTAVYDDSTNTMILFGGTGVVGDLTTPFNDVWILTNADGLGGEPVWVQLDPGGVLPPPRAEHSAVYDSATNTMIVFGGDNRNQGLNDVWALSHANGHGGTPTWTQLSPTGAELPPLLTRHHRAAYSQAKNVMIVTVTLPTNAVEVWLLSEANGLGGIPRWAKSAVPVGPTWAWEHSLVYDEAGDRIILFGGAGCCWTAPFLNDVWTLSEASEEDERVPFSLFAVNPITDELLRLHSSTGERTVIGPIGFGNVSGLAYDTQRDILFSVDNATGQLIQINPQTGEGTAIGPVGLGGSHTDPGHLGLDMKDLTFGPNNTLFGLTNAQFSTSRIITINPLTGQGQLASGVISQQLDGLAFQPRSGRMFASWRFGFGGLFEVDLSSKTVVPLGNIGSGFTRLAADSNSDQLFVIGNRSFQNDSRLFLIDPSTLARTLIGFVGVSGSVSGIESVVARAADTPPPPPTGLTAVMGDQSAILYWDEPEEDIDGWEVQIKEPGSTAFSLLTDSTTESGLIENPLFPLSNAQSTPSFVLQEGTTEVVVKAVRGAVGSAASEIFRLVKAAAEVTSKPEFPVLFLHGIPGQAIPGESDNTWKERLFCDQGWVFGGFLTIDGNSPEETPNVVFTPATPANCPLPPVADNPAQADFFIAGFRNRNANYLNNNGLYNWAKEIEAFLATLRRETQKDKFILVAHSAGGLAARAYIQPPGSVTPGDVPIPHYNNDVAHLVTFGTPHLGVKLEEIADRLSVISDELRIGGFFIGSFIILKFFEDLDTNSKGLLQVREGSEFLTDLNLRISRKDIRFTAILGGSEKICSAIFPFLEKNDCLVEVNSQDLSEVILSAKVYPPPGSCGGFVNAFHPTEPEHIHAVLIAVGARSALFCGASPIDLEITDPDGLRIGRDFTEIPGALYRELIFGTDSDRKNLVGIPFAKPGEYQVTIIPEPEASPTDTFTLEVTLDGVTTVLAQDQQIQNIPAQPYTVDVPILVKIDIKPGSDTNPINLKSKGVIPVAILTTSVAAGDAIDFDTTRVDQPTLTLAGASAKRKGKSGNIGSFEDVDGDGDLDLVVQFSTAELQLAETDTEATLDGKTLDGTSIRGTDTIRVVPDS